MCVSVCVRLCVIVCLCFCAWKVYQKPGFDHVNVCLFIPEAREGTNQETLHPKWNPNSDHLNGEEEDAGPRSFRFLSPTGRAQLLGGAMGRRPSKRGSKMAVMHYSVASDFTLFSLILLQPVSK